MRWFCILLVLVSFLYVSSCKHRERSRNQSELPKGEAAKDLNNASGVIQGRVIYAGIQPARQKLLVVKDTAVCGKHDHYDERLVVGKGSGIQNAVISLHIVEDGKPLAAMGTEFVLDQTGCAYQPHVLLLPVHMPLRLLNSDGLLHNIHTYSTKNQPVNLSHPKSKPRLTIQFSEPEKIQVKCDIHGWMDSWIIAVDHPYHAVTDGDGNFVIPDVPAGIYSVTCWQEMLGEQTTEITVTADASVTADFKYTASQIH